MATHSSVLAWRVPGTGEPGMLQSMGLQRVRHDLNNDTSTQIHSTHTHTHTHTHTQAHQGHPGVCLSHLLVVIVIAELLEIFP